VGKRCHRPQADGPIERIEPCVAGAKRRESAAFSKRPQDSPAQ
jgi:hypothetical protein